LCFFRFLGRFLQYVVHLETKFAESFFRKALFTTQAVSGGNLGGARGGRLPPSPPLHLHGKWQIFDKFFPPLQVVNNASDLLGNQNARKLIWYGTFILIHSYRNALHFLNNISNVSRVKWINRAIAKKLKQEGISIAFGETFSAAKNCWILHFSISFGLTYVILIFS
jgi:hypothetical protein